MSRTIQHILVLQNYCSKSRTYDRFRNRHIYIYLERLRGSAYNSQKRYL